ncbi:MAG: GHKL domain-containing protein [Lachnospiraceae bacterium]|nr:GHKL domain-containing protein [Lachnospiraceae bacterium]
MKGSLTRKLIVFYLLIAGILFLVVNTVLAGVAERTILKEREKIMYTQIGMITDGYIQRYYDNGVTISTLMENLEPVAELMDVRILITASKGKVVGDTAPISDNVIQLDEVAPGFLEETFHRDFYNQAVTDERVLAVVVPLISQYMVKGYVCMMMPMTSVNREVSEAVYEMNWYYLATMVILLLVFIGIYLFFVIPLKRTIVAAKAYSMGNFETKPNLRSGGEFRALADVIGYMGDTMYRFNEYQREIISNVSHDFRSPLTSIKGYVEAIKDGTIPPEQQERYLDVVLFEVERLTKLTSNLLTLNTMDRQGLILQPSEFDVNEMIKNLARTFEGQCKKKRLVIQLVFSAKEIFVTADRDKIAQVLYNLVDNAIKFSHADAVIRITVEEKGRKALVAVKDTGFGIPKDELTKIWDRFYKSDSSRGKDKKGTGLGLSIVKEIMTAHKENINVISTEGVGTEFVFTLPLVLTEEI